MKNRNNEMTMRLKELEKSDREYMDNAKSHKKPKHKTNYRKAV